MQQTAARPVTPSSSSAAGMARSVGVRVLAGIVIVVIAVAGAAFGRFIDHITHGASANGIAAANATAPYGLIIGVIAVLRSRPGRAAIDAAVFFGSFVVGYYFTVAHELGTAAVNRHYAAVWLLLAVAACPVIAAAVTWARRGRGVLRAIVFALPAAAACTEAISGRTWAMAGLISPVVIVLDGVLVLVYLLILPAGMITKAAAVAWTVPLVTALSVVTAPLAQSGAYDRWMY